MSSSHHPVHTCPNNARQYDNSVLYKGAGGNEIPTSLPRVSHPLELMHQPLHNPISSILNRSAELPSEQLMETFLCKPWTGDSQFSSYWCLCLMRNTDLLLFHLAGEQESSLVLLHSSTGQGLNGRHSPDVTERSPRVCFLPILLIPPVLQKICQDRAWVILIVPNWLRQF